MSQSVAERGTAAARLGQPIGYALVAVFAALFVAGVLVGAASSRPEPVLSTLGGSWSEKALTQAAQPVAIGWVRAYFLILNLLPAVPGLIAAALVLRGARTWFRCYAGAALALFGTMSGAIPAVYQHEVDGTLGEALGALTGLAWVGLFPLLYAFPDGRVAPRWARWCIVGWALLLPYFALVAALDLGGASDPAQTLPLLALFGTAAFAAVYRYRKVSTPEQRRQTRGIVGALVLWFSYIVVLAVTPLGDWLEETTGRGLVAGAVLFLVSHILVALIPAAIAVGILRYRLFEVDLWVNRTLVYVALTGVVALAYALVSLIGTYLWPDNDVVGPMALAVLLGIGFQPIRARAQRAVDRFVYGRRKEPYAVLTDLGRQLASVLPPDQVLRTIVGQVGGALKLPYAAATLTGSSVSVTWPPDLVAPPSGKREEFALSWQDQELGRLVVVSSPGDDLSAADRDLLDGVARQAGTAIRAATLNDELRRSRERILGAREDERRRLQRDLHDGLGPTLASLYQRIDLARSMLAEQPDTAEKLLGEVGEQTRSVIGEIRTLVAALRPSELELGLVGAIGASAQRLPELRVQIQAADLPVLPPAVETAAYRIAMEALTNAARHAGASTATVRLVIDAGALRIEVQDDGRGLPPELVPGTGLRSMRERAHEFGGTVDITVPAAGGTRVQAVVPFAGGAG